MIEINLLPEESKKRRKNALFKIPDMTFAFFPILIWSLVALVSIHLLLLLILSINKAAYTKMSEEYNKIKPEKETLELAKRENLQLNKNVDAIEALMKGKVLWFRKTNQLSDLVIPGLWFTKISLDKKINIAESKRPKPQKAEPHLKGSDIEKVDIPYLDIEGAVSSYYGDEVGVIGKFIKQLKSDPEFFKDFTDIELGSTKLESVEGVDVMRFNIHCYFKTDVEE